MDLWSQLDRQARHWNVLEHPFYEQWSAGALSRADLAAYAGEYRHAVVALSRRSRRRGGGAHRALGPLRPFSGRGPRPPRIAGDRGLRPRMGGRASLLRRPPRGAVRHRVRPTRDRGYQGGRPAPAHYGLDTPDATAYFDLHTERDVEHAAEGRELLARHAADTDSGELVTEAGRVLRANWTLLDGVERALGRA